MMLSCKTVQLALLTVLIALVNVAFTPHVALAGTDHVERLIQDATSASGTNQRLQAVEALGHSGDLRALQPLLDLLHDVDPSIRQHAFKALQTLVQHLRQIYTHLAQWIDSLLLRLDIYLAPEPPVEQTKTQHVI
jgi:HEAT repeat protein